MVKCKNGHDMSEDTENLLYYCPICDSESIDPLEVIKTACHNHAVVDLDYLVRILVKNGYPQIDISKLLMLIEMSILEK